MVRKKGKIEERKEAFRLSLAGKTHREIAKELNRAPKTINNWSVEENWEKLKSENYAKAHKNIFDKYREKIEEICSKALDGSRIIIHTAVEELNYIRTENPNPGREKPIRDNIESWGKILHLGTNIQKNTIPEAGSELSEFILQELRKINERSEKTNN